MTGSDLIKSSMRLIGVLGSGEPLSNDEANDALTALNQMIDTWSTDNLLIYSKALETFTLTGNKQSYTWGTGGDFNSARPLKVENALIRTTSGSTSVDLPLEIYNQDQWANISVKTTSSTLPRAIYVEGTYPLETILLWPVPTAANTLVVFSWKPLANISLLTSTVDLPPAYARALRYNLAVELAPEYGRQLDPVIIENAAQAKAHIKRLNTKPIYLSMDETALGARKSFNWLIGE